MRLMGNAPRRLAFDEPVSRLAIWAKALAKVALLLALVAIVAAHARGGLARFFAVLTLRPGPSPDPALGLFILLAALAVAALALALAFGAALSIWLRGRRGVGRIFATLALLALFLPYPAWLYYSAEEPPFLADISTDMDDPPAFSDAPPARAGRGGWTPPPIERARRDAQAAAYPEVKPMTLDMETEEAFKAALDTAKQLRWNIVEAIQPGGPARPEGHIEALTFSPALKLPVAIVIRVRPGQDETRVDMRAVTRYLPNDLGGGAALIGKLSDALEEKDGSQ
jgi:Protein of unknown function (DUF1499)